MDELIVDYEKLGIISLLVGNVAALVKGWVIPKPAVAKIEEEKEFYRDLVLQLVGVTAEGQKAVQRAVDVLRK